MHCVRVFIYVYVQGGRCSHCSGGEGARQIDRIAHILLFLLLLLSSPASHPPSPTRGPSVLRGEEEAGWATRTAGADSQYGRRPSVHGCLYSVGKCCVCPYSSEYTRPPVPFSHATRVFDGFSRFFAVLPALPIPPISSGNRRTTVLYRKKKKKSHFYVFRRPSVTVNRTIQFNDYTPQLPRPFYTVKPMPALGFKAKYLRATR